MILGVLSLKKSFVFILNEKPVTNQLKVATPKLVDCPNYQQFWSNLLGSFECALQL